CLVFLSLRDEFSSLVFQSVSHRDFPLLPLSYVVWRVSSSGTWDRWHTLSCLRVSSSCVVSRSVSHQRMVLSLARCDPFDRCSHGQWVILAVSCTTQVGS